MTSLGKVEASEEPDVSVVVSGLGGASGDRPEDDAVDDEEAAPEDGSGGMTV